MEFYDNDASYDDNYDYDNDNDNYDVENYDENDQTEYDVVEGFSSGHRHHPDQTGWGQSSHVRKFGGGHFAAAAIYGSVGCGCGKKPSCGQKPACGQKPKKERCYKVCI